LKIEVIKHCTTLVVSPGYLRLEIFETKSILVENDKMLHTFSSVFNDVARFPGRVIKLAASNSKYKIINTNIYVIFFI